MKELIWIASYIFPPMFLAALCAVTWFLARWIGLDPRSTVIIFLCVTILRDWAVEFRRSLNEALT